TGGAPWKDAGRRRARHARPNPTPPSPRTVANHVPGDLAAAGYDPRAREVHRVVQEPGRLSAAPCPPDPGADGGRDAAERGPVADPDLAVRGGPHPGRPGRGGGGGLRPQIEAGLRGGPGLAGRLRERGALLCSLGSSPEGGRLRSWLGP